jgi:hypothetical protein
VGLVLAQDLTIASDYGQFYLFDNAAVLADSSTGSTTRPRRFHSMTPSSLAGSSAAGARAT